MHHRIQRILIVLFISGCIISITKAQVKNSVYTMFGVGQLTDNSYGINKAMGGTGIAFNTGRSTNYLNPASYFGMPKNSVLLELGLYGVYNKSATNKTSQSDMDINLSYFSVATSFADWWTSSMGIVPFSYVDYEISTKDAIEGELITLNKTYKGEGGINSVYWGNSFRIFEGLYVGLDLSYLTGPVTQTETADATDNFSGYEFVNKRTAVSFYMDYGIQYRLKQDDWFYTVGMIYGASKKLNTTDEIEFTYNGDTIELEQEDQLDIKIPEKLGVGLALSNGNNFRAGFDYKWESWSSINFSNPNLDTKNSHRFSVGAEYTRSEERKRTWLNSLFYRFGLNYKKSYLEIDETQINSFGINVGLGIPFDEFSIINLAIEYGEEGTFNKGLIKNSYWTLYLNISLHEFWNAGL